MPDSRLIFPYDVRFNPTPVPETGVLDEPRLCVSINVDWWTQVDSVLERLIYNDAWRGSDVDQERAIDAVEVIRRLVNKGGECMTCADETFEIIDGHLWRTCGEEEAEDLGQVVGANGNDGLDGAVGDTGATGAKGDTGDTGATGAAGTPGVDGGDGLTPPDDVPGVDGDDKRCAVATAVANEVANVFHNTFDAATTKRAEIQAGSFAAVGLGVLIFPGLGVAIAGMTALITLFNIGLQIEADGYDALFDGAVTQDLQCRLYCLLTENGRYTTTVHDAFIEDVRDEGSAFYGVIADVIQAAGRDNFAWAAQSASLLADPDCGGCDDCPEDEDWCVMYDFTIESYGDTWSSSVQDGTGWGASWVTSTGWQNASTAFAMRMNVLSGAHVTELWLDCTGDSVVFEQHQTTAYNSTIIVDGLVSPSDAPTIVDYTLSEDGVLILARSVGHSPNVRKLRLKGNGTRPVGGVDC